MAVHGKRTTHRCGRLGLRRRSALARWASLVLGLLLALRQLGGRVWRGPPPRVRGRPALGPGLQSRWRPARRVGAREPDPPHRRRRDDGRRRCGRPLSRWAQRHDRGPGRPGLRVGVPCPCRRPAHRPDPRGALGPALPRDPRRARRSGGRGPRGAERHGAEPRRSDAGRRRDDRTSAHGLRCGCRRVAQRSPHVRRLRGAQAGRNLHGSHGGGLVRQPIHVRVRARPRRRRGADDDRHAGSVGRVLRSRGRRGDSVVRDRRSHQGGIPAGGGRGAIEMCRIEADR